MKAGDIVRCINASYSEGRLIEGKMYVISKVDGSPARDTSPFIPVLGPDIQILGATPPDIIGNPPEMRYWKSSRFATVNSKDLENKVHFMIGDKIKEGAK